MTRFPPEHLDLDRLIANLVERKDTLALLEANIDALDEGFEQDQWIEQANAVRDEIELIDELIVTKKEHDRASS